MNIKDFFGKKRNILIKYSLQDLKTKLNNFETVLTLQFLNKISQSNFQKGTDNIIVEIDLSFLSNDDIFNTFILYIENLILNYKKYEDEKINQFLFFIDGYVSIYGEEKLKKYELSYNLFKKRKLTK